MPRGRFRWLFIVGVVLVLGALYAGLRRHTADQPGETMPAARAFDLSTGEQRPGDLLPTFTVNQGDGVKVSIEPGAGGELHVHGYDLKVPLEPGKAATLTFQARYGGQYPIELHLIGGGERQLARLVVQPR